MLTTKVALHGEHYGILRRMPDNTEAGFGPSYVSSRGRGWVFYNADCAWPNFYFINCDSLDEAIEHAEICILDIEEDVEDLCAQFDIIGNKVEEILYENDCTICEDGRVRMTKSLNFFEWK